MRCPRKIWNGPKCLVSLLRCVRTLALTSPWLGRLPLHYPSAVDMGRTSGSSGAQYLDGIMEVAVFFAELNFAILDYEQEVIVVLVGLAVLQLGVALGFDCHPVALGGNSGDFEAYRHLEAGLTISSNSAFVLVPPIEDLAIIIQVAESAK